jgi:hypothetical protein
MKFRHALTASALAMAVAVHAVPAKASTVTELITFTDTATYGVSYNPPTADDLLHGYQGTAVATGSFDITYDPALNYLLPQSISNGVITNLSYSVTDPYFSSSPLTLDPITSFQIAYGFLTLYSAPPTVTPVGTPDISIVINLSNAFSAVYYSQTGYDDTLTTNGFGSLSITGSASAAPLPSTWTMLVAGFVGLGYFAFRGSKKDNVAAQLII